MAVQSRGRALIIALLALILGGLGYWFGQSIRIDTSIKALLPATAPSVQALARASAEQGTTDRLTVAMQASDPAVVTRFGRDLAAKIQTWPDVQAIYAARDLTLLRDHALYFLEPQDLVALRDELQAAKQSAVIAATRPGLSDSDIPLAAVQVGDDWDQLDSPPSKPAGAAPPATAAPVRNFEQWLDQQKQRFADDPRFRPHEIAAIWPHEDEKGHLAWPAKVEVPLQNDDGTIQVIQARLARPATDIQYARDVSARVQAAIDALQPTTYASDLRAMVVGSYEISEDVDTIIVDLNRATWLSAILVTAVLLVGFRSARGLVVVLLPVTIAILITLALSRAIYGELNILTAFLFAVLFGMGVDFSIHLLAHRSYADAKTTWGEIVNQQWRPLLSSAATTAFCLLALLTGQFKAFREFGLLSAIGIAASLLCALVLVPCFDVLWGPWRQRTRKVSPAAPPSQASWPQATVNRRVVRLRWAIIAAILAIFAAGGPRMRFENNTDKMRASVSQRSEKRIAYGAALGKRSTGVPVVLVAENPEALDRAVDVLEHAKADEPWLKSVVSAKSAMPRDQAAKVPLLRDIGNLSQELLDLSAKQAGSPAVQKDRQNLEVLRRLAEKTPLQQDQLPSWALEPFTTRSGDHDRLAHAHLAFKQSDLNAVRDVVTRFRQLLSGLQVQGAASSFVFADLAQLLEHDGARLPLVCLVTIYVVMLLDLRRWRAATECFLSLLLGLALALGVLGLCGININFFNLAIIPAVIGTGIDTSIHLWHARAQPEGVSPGTNLGAILSGLTTIGAFAGLLIAQTPGLRSMAIVGITTITAAIFAAFVVLWLGQRRKR